jgi:hypothetical protein
MEPITRYDDPEERRRFWRACLIWLAIWTLLLIMLFLTNVRCEWRLNNVYVRADAVIIDKEIERIPCEDDAVYEARFLVRYRPAEADEPRHTWAYYQAYGQPREGADTRSILNSFTIGKEYPCWYDPDDPAKVALSQSYSSHAFNLVVVIASILLVSICWLGWQARRKILVA